MNKLNWNVPCGLSCVLGKPVGEARNGYCLHADQVHSLGMYELKQVIKTLYTHRRGLVEELRRFQKGQEIESDYIDPFDDMGEP